MPREMPLLKHRGDKLVAGKSFWSVPQDIMVYAFKHLTYSETQVLMYLMGNKPAEDGYDGWQISNINDCVSGTDSTVRAARRTLADMGFIQQIPGKRDSTYETIIVDFPWIREVVKNDWNKETAKLHFKNRSGSPAP